MSPRTRRHGAFLQFLYVSDPTQRKELIGMASNEQIFEGNCSQTVRGSSDYFRLLRIKTKSLQGYPSVFKRPGCEKHRYQEIVEEEHRGHTPYSQTSFQRWQRSTFW